MIRKGPDDSRIISRFLAQSLLRIVTLLVRGRIGSFG